MIPQDLWPILQNPNRSVNDPSTEAPVTEEEPQAPTDYRNQGAIPKSSRRSVHIEPEATASTEHTDQQQNDTENTTAIDTIIKQEESAD